MSNKERNAEQELREMARSSAGKVIKGSGERVAPRTLHHMVSVRLDAGLITDLRRIAKANKSSVSDLLREGAQMVVATHNQPQPMRIKTTYYVGSFASVLNSSPELPIAKTG